MQPNDEGGVKPLNIRSSRTDLPAAPWMIFGSVTQSLLKASPVPLFMVAPTPVRIILQRSRAESHEAQIEQVGPRTGPPHMERMARRKLAGSVPLRLLEAVLITRLRGSLRREESLLTKRASGLVLQWLEQV